MREQLRARLGEVWPELEIAAEARNGAEAVELVAAERPDVVFLDIRMPAKSGIEAAREIAALPRESRVPEIVFVTAYDQYAIDGFEQGVIDYVLKPAERGQRARDPLINARAMAAISRDERGHQLVSIKGRPEKLEVSRSYAHLFKGM